MCRGHVQSEYRQDGAGAGVERSGGWEPADLTRVAESGYAVPIKVGSAVIAGPGGPGAAQGSRPTQLPAGLPGTCR